MDMNNELPIVLQDVTVTLDELLWYNKLTTERKTGKTTKKWTLPVLAGIALFYLLITITLERGIVRDVMIVLTTIAMLFVFVLIFTKNNLVKQIKKSIIEEDIYSGLTLPTEISLGIEKLGTKNYKSMSTLQTKSLRGIVYVDQKYIVIYTAPSAGLIIPFHMFSEEAISAINARITEIAAHANILITSWES